MKPIKIKYIKTEDNIYTVKEDLNTYYHCAIDKNTFIDIPKEDVIEGSDKLVNLLEGIKIELEERTLIDSIQNLSKYLDKQGVALPKHKIFGLINEDKVICRIYSKTGTFLIR